jgi:hypothetical protein
MRTAQRDENPLAPPGRTRHPHAVAAFAPCIRENMRSMRCRNGFIIDGSLMILSGSSRISQFLPSIYRLIK